MGIIGAAVKAASERAADGAGAAAGHAVDGARAIRHFAAEQSEILEGLRDVRRIVGRERRQEQLEQAGEQVAAQPPEADDGVDPAGVEETAVAATDGSGLSETAQLAPGTDDGGSLEMLGEAVGGFFAWLIDQF